MAKCLLCSKLLSNTSKSRLLMHRNLCNIKKLRTKVPCIENSSEPRNAFISHHSHQVLLKSKRDKMHVIESDSDVDDPEVTAENSNTNNITSKSLVVSETNSLNSSANFVLNSSTSLNESLTTPAVHQLSSESGSDSFEKNKKKVQSAVQRYHDKITAEEIDLINFKLGKLFFGCNIPFSVVESIHFKEFCQALRPDYGVPSRPILSTSILNKVHNNLSSNMHFRAESALLIDGWKNETSNTNNVACLLQVASGEALFLESFDLTGIKDAGKELAEIVNTCIDLALNRHNTHIYAVITDNAANMVRVGKLTEIWHLTCNSHTGSLLAKDLVSAKLTGHVKVLLKAFHGPGIEKQLIKHGGKRIQMPCETRWCTYRDSFSNLLYNIPHMKQATSDYNLPQEEHKYLFDANFINNLSNSIKLFDPVCELINLCQKSTTSIADAAEAWLNLPNKIPDGYQEFNEVIMKRRKYALNKYLLTSNILHPRYQGKNMSSDDRDQVEDFILNSSGMSADGLNSYIEFKEKSGIFETLFTKQNLSTNAFWAFAKQKHPELYAFASKLLNLPASTTQLERVFSNWSYVHNNLRNCLTPDRSKKLMSVYYSLKLSENTKSPSTEH